jgi:anti-sigma factor RsiW
MFQVLSTYNDTEKHDDQGKKMKEKQARPKQVKNEKALWRQCRIRLPKPDKCPDAGIMAAYVDHGLSEKENSKLEGHLVQCQACLDTILFLKAIENDRHTPVPTKDRIAAIDLVSPRSSRRTEKKERLSGWLFPLPITPAFAAVLLVLVCLTGLYLGNRTGADRMLVKNMLATELLFGLDQPFEINSADGEEG